VVGFVAGFLLLDSDLSGRCVRSTVDRGAQRAKARDAMADELRSKPCSRELGTGALPDRTARVPDLVGVSKFADDPECQPITED
jgi:hypothetical protein